MNLTSLICGLLVLVLATSISFAEEEAERTAKDVVKDLKDRDRGVKLLAIGESAVDDEVRVPANGRCEVEVAPCRQSKMKAG